MLDDKSGSREIAEYTYNPDMAQMPEPQERLTRRERWLFWALILAAVVAGWGPVIYVIWRVW